MDAKTHFPVRRHDDRVKPTSWWAAHFRTNRERDWGIAWDSGLKLDEPGSRRIADSIAEFQRGESSEARNYLAKSEEYSGRTGDPSFHAASVLFVREENQHAALLLRFMNEVGIARRERVFSDGIFRWLRSFGDIGWSSRVLMIAELIAQEYYPCLRESTAHPALQRLCDKIEYDEEAHIRFQIERIVRVEAAHGNLATMVRSLAQRALMVGAALVVCAGHHRVIRARLAMKDFLARVFERNSRAIEGITALRRDRAKLAGDGVVRLSTAR